MFTKSWYNKTKGFQFSNKAEGLGLTHNVKLKTIALTNPLYNMTAVVHGKNTINKDKFKDEGSKLDPSNISFEEKTTEFIKAIVGCS